MRVRVRNTQAASDRGGRRLRAETLRATTAAGWWFGTGRGGIARAYVPVPHARRKGKRSRSARSRTGYHRASRLAMHLGMFVRALRRKSTSGRFAPSSTVVSVAAAAAAVAAQLTRFAR